MIRFFTLLSFMAFLSFAPASVMAQEDADAVLAETSDEEQAVKEAAPIKDVGAEEEKNYEKRLELSRQMHEIWPVRPKIESALDAIAEQITPTERLKFKAALRNAIKFDALEEASVEAMADIYSEKELVAMIAFYGSKEGRSVSHKTGDYERALEPVLTKMVDKALLDIKLGSE